MPRSSIESVKSGGSDDSFVRPARENSNVGFLRMALSPLNGVSHTLERRDALPRERISASLARTGRRIRSFSRASSVVCPPTRRAMASATDAAGLSSDAPKHVLVAGAGVIGSSIAYHLAVNHGIRATVYDKVGPGCAASGKAGGFLALDWCDGSPVGPLARASFRMHAEIAEKLHLNRTAGSRARRSRWTRRPSPPPAARPSRNRATRNSSPSSGPTSAPSRPAPWATRPPSPRSIPRVSSTRTSTPREIAVGTDVVVGDVTALAVDPEGSCVGLVVDGDVVRADAVVVAMGPWTNRVVSASLVPRVRGQKYHAVLMRPERVLSQCVFFQGLGDPEFYPRGDGDVYVCAYPDPPVDVSEEPGAVEVRPDAVQRLVDVARKVSTEMAAAEVNETDGRGQSCHLPVTADGTPVMGGVPGISGAYVAYGHSCWGILNSPASGGDGGTDHHGEGDVRGRLRRVRSGEATMNDAVVCAHSSGPSVAVEASSIVARGVSRFRVFVFAGRESFASSRSTQLHFVGASVSFWDAFASLSCTNPSARPDGSRGVSPAPAALSSNHSPSLAAGLSLSTFPMATVFLVAEGELVELGHVGELLAADDAGGLDANHRQASALAKHRGALLLLLGLARLAVNLVHDLRHLALLRHRVNVESQPCNRR